MNLSSFIVIQEVINEKPFLMHIPFHASHDEAHAAALKMAENILEMKKQVEAQKAEAEAAAKETPAAS